MDRTSSYLYDVPAGVVEWADLGTPIQPALTNGKKGNITVSQGFSWSWLGLAQIWVEDGHITKGKVTLNTDLLAYYEANGYPGAADHVECQEIGHVLGLDHNRTDLDTCMNDQALLGSATAPNAHDAEQLNLIYNHTDATEEKGGPPAGKGKKGGNKQGKWITVHVFPLPDGKPGNGPK